MDSTIISAAYQAVEVSIEAGYLKVIDSDSDSNLTAATIMTIISQELVVIDIVSTDSMAANTNLVANTMSIVRRVAITNFIVVPYSFFITYSPHNPPSMERPPCTVHFLKV